ncbi:hypothetical protein PPTG_19043 [Phytophthora nicotianae INRA-310]|uniref:DUF7726 domain-containing protein n=4 Tax=Phytophthora nicotianae TaxID=4792 RepID=W2PEF3_PHYN3|nr:hypothetical protein PPTG_19043 [Phytophthora nicotianae INRA-310]ETI55266.1 hypothetical protein F443_02042 [Phytophthora nicotianae P1569]ETM54776.1 hypothetical protein L914_01938 [Phytophthora nicotianae]ETM99030.1 hypothetical protein PPTG_19043 [Phytophthora nicotianae INRA-310]ETO66066.1 hypothetical protein F444_16694 [Phytophthora nicotianae P1976]
MSETTAASTTTHAPTIDIGPTSTSTSASTEPAPALVDDEEYSDDGFDSQNLRYNCNQLHAKIREFLGTKEMTLKEFPKECQVNPGPYYRFMDLNGRGRGDGNTSFIVFY